MGANVSASTEQRGIPGRGETSGISENRNQQSEVTFSDLVTAAYQTRGAGQVEEMVRLAINACRVAF
jgi:hypothetical protein